MDIEDVNITINNLELTDICGPLQPIITEYILFSNAYRLYSRRDHISILGNKTISKYLKARNHIKFRDHR